MKADDQLFRFLGWNTQGDLGPWTFYTSQRSGLVYFVKAPPLEPPSLLQTTVRNQFRLAGYTWRSLAAHTQRQWQLAAERAHLRITGYNLFTFYLLKNDDAAIRTVERLSGINLIPLLEPLTP